MARVVRAQGRRGEVAVELFTDFPELLAVRKCLYALQAGGARRELEVEAAWPHKGRLVLKIRGCDSIDQAEQLLGCELQVLHEERVPLPAGAAYVSDLVGCVVVDVSRGVTVGTIEDVQFGAGDAPLLVVRGAGRQFLVPFAAEFVRKMDLEARRLELVLPEGLLELDQPPARDETQRREMSLARRSGKSSGNP